MRNDFDHEKINDFLSKLELPDVQAPLFKQKLKRQLLERRNFMPEPYSSVAMNFLRGLFAPVKSYSLYPIAAIAVVLLIAFASYIPMPARAFAHLVLEVNPAVRLTIDSENNVIDFEPLDQTSVEVFKNVNLRRISVEKALDLIVSQLFDSTLITPEDKVYIVMYPARTEYYDKLADSLAKAESALAESLTEFDPVVKISSFALNAETFSAVEKAGFKPSQYARLLERGLSHVGLHNFVYMADKPDVDREHFTENFEEFADQIITVIEQDVPESEAISIARESMAARMDAEGLRGTVNRFYRLLDEDFAPRAAAAHLKEEIRSGKNFRNIKRNGSDQYKQEKGNDEDNNARDNRRTPRGDIDNRPDDGIRNENRELPPGLRNNRRQNREDPESNVRDDSEDSDGESTDAEQEEIRDE